MLAPTTLCTEMAHSNDSAIALVLILITTLPNPSLTPEWANADANTLGSMSLPRTSFLADPGLAATFERRLVGTK